MVVRCENCGYEYDSDLRMVKDNREQFINLSEFSTDMKLTGKIIQCPKCDEIDFDVTISDYTVINKIKGEKRCLE